MSRAEVGSILPTPVIRGQAGAGQGAVETRSHVMGGARRAYGAGCTRQREGAGSAASGTLQGRAAGDGGALQLVRTGADARMRGWNGLPGVRLCANVIRSEGWSPHTTMCAGADLARRARAARRTTR